MNPSYRASLAVLLTALFTTADARAQGIAPQEPESLLRHPAVRDALRHAEESEPRTIEEQIALCGIPAPPFGEAERAAAYAERMRAIGLVHVRIDAEGNAIGERPGESDRPTVILAAHLDTVFPAGTDLTVRRDGAILRGPGIGDDCRGLAVVLAVAHALEAANVRTRGTVVFVGTVGEEGRGDLRGSRHLVDHELADRIDAFVGIDGAGLDLTKDAVGSRRYQVTFRGPGGHSYGDFGDPSPIHALGRAIAKIADFEVPDAPKTTFNVGVVEGGISVNAIAREAAMDVDMRSIDGHALEDLDARFHEAIREALADENARARDETRVEVEIAEIGVRPAGRQPDDAPIVQAGVATARALGFDTRLEAGSTDANAMIARGIPAVTIDGGSKGGGAHSIEEWFDTTDSDRGTRWALLYVLSLVGVSGSAADR